MQATIFHITAVYMTMWQLLRETFQYHTGIL